jgi:two-component system KDP operon response regulator KdpE
MDIPATAAAYSALIVEDDPALQTVMSMLAEGNGFRAVIAGTCDLAIREARSSPPDVAIVDLGLPDGDGIDFVRNTRTWSSIPLIVLSARNEESQRLAAFAAGADDYVVKPFSSPELFARIRALLRCRVPAQADVLLERGGIALELGRHVARRWDGEEVRLTPLEHRILETLARHPDRVVMHERLLHEVWGPDQADMRSLRVYIKTLRRKLERDPAQPVHIVTESGVGYRLALNPLPA